MDTAIFVVDMQNGFLDPDGSTVAHGTPVPNVDKLVANNAALLAEARSAGCPVVYTRHQYRPGLPDMPPALRAMFPEGIEPLVAGTWDAAVVDDLAPAADDLIIDKNRFDAFLYTDAEVVLRALGVRRLLVTGVVTNVCVESSVRSAQQRDFAVTVASDCVGGPDPELHRGGLAAMGSLFATVLPWREALEGLVD